MPFVPIMGGLQRLQQLRSALHTRPMTTNAPSSTFRCRGLLSCQSSILPAAQPPPPYVNADQSHQGGHMRDALSGWFQTHYSEKFDILRRETVALARSGCSQVIAGVSLCEGAPRRRDSGWHDSDTAYTGY